MLLQVGLGLASEGEITDLLLNDSEGDCTLSALQVKAKKLDDTSVLSASSPARCVGSALCANQIDKNLCNFWKEQGCKWKTEEKPSRSKATKEKPSKSSGSSKKSVHGPGHCHGPTFCTYEPNKESCELARGQGCKWVD